MPVRSAVGRRGRRFRVAPRSLLCLFFLLYGGLAQEGSPAPVNSNERGTLTGAGLFERHCAVCHGASGAGLQEARLAFPPDHRRCERCHKPGNPRTMTFEQMELRQHDLFEIGKPPPLVGEGALAAAVDHDSLTAYLQATMPRYQPGSLSRETYEALASYLLVLNGRSPPAP